MKNMASNSRRQIETWIGTLEITGSVIDIGGLFWPVRGRTRIWEVDNYKILDIKDGRKGIQTDYVYDINRPIQLGKYIVGSFNNAFCIEVTDHLWNPVRAFTNINHLLKKEGMLYISSNFLFPHHTGYDCIRLTHTGLQRILEETGFKVLSIVPRQAASPILFRDMMAQESKVDYAPGEIGYMVTAQKL